MHDCLVSITYLYRFIVDIEELFHLGGGEEEEITLFKFIKYIHKMYTKYTEIYKFWIRDVGRPLS